MICNYEKNIEEAWHDFFALRHPSLREVIAIHYIKTAKRIVSSLSRSWISAICHIDDLESLSMICLMEAIDAFDPNRVNSWQFHNPFCNYLNAHIRQSAIDWYRIETWGSRGQVSVSKEVKSFCEKEIKRTGAKPSFSDIVDMLALPETRKAGSPIPTPQYVERAVEACKPPKRNVEIHRVNHLDIDSLSTKELFNRILAENAFNLDSRELQIMRLTYCENQTKNDIAKITGIPAGTIGHCRVRAIRKIRQKMQTSKNSIWSVYERSCCN